MFLLKTFFYLSTHEGIIGPNDLREIRLFLIRRTNPSMHLFLNIRLDSLIKKISIFVPPSNMSKWFDGTLLLYNQLGKDLTIFSDGVLAFVRWVVIFE